MKHNTGVLHLSLWASLISLFAGAQKLSETTRLVTSTLPTATSINTSIRDATSTGIAVSSAAATQDVAAVSRFNEQILGIVLAATLCSIAFGVLATILGHIRRQERKRADRATLTLTPLTVEGQTHLKVHHRSSLADTAPYETQADRQSSVLYDNDSAIAGLEHGPRAQVPSKYPAHSTVPASLHVQHASRSSQMQSRSIDVVSASEYSDMTSLGEQAVREPTNRLHGSALPLVPPRSPRRLESDNCSYFSHMQAQAEHPSDRRERRQGWFGVDSIVNRHGLD